MHTEEGETVWKWSFHWKLHPIGSLRLSIFPYLLENTISIHKSEIVLYGKETVQSRVWHGNRTNPLNITV